MYVVSNWDKSGAHEAVIGGSNWGPGARIFVRDKKSDPSGVDSVGTRQQVGFSAEGRWKEVAALQVGPVDRYADAARQSPYRQWFLHVSFGSLSERHAPCRRLVNAAAVNNNIRVGRSSGNKWQLHAHR